MTDSDRFQTNSYFHGELLNKFFPLNLFHHASKNSLPNKCKKYSCGWASSIHKAVYFSWSINKSAGENCVGVQGSN